MMNKLRDRAQAGQMLAQKLSAYNRPEVIVLGLPRGGVLVAYEVAKALHVPLDVCIVRKLGLPGHKELAIGAIASDGVRVLNYDVISHLNISSKTIDEVAARELRELQRRDHTYRGQRPLPDLRHHTIILVDDGIATGSTIRAAIAVLKQEQPKQIIVAVPVAPPDICKQLKTEVDEVVCLIQPEPMYTIAIWYDHFSQITDEQVRHLLEESTLRGCLKSFEGSNFMPTASP
ncbi:phosphoribosyltransferase [Scytonema sp. UIC 10036]|uniref:phosphoribosyltransferase n=1 Tax=Scytonema sp. UIC 10036 TaxID=2304196 RepID=UPI0012DA5631|nr:phosphoribosyltransferase [Scytonema sp. UIC 10036]MUG93631.1 phosphoribosyltransferase [Scytonema sp. UIC 10036]